MTTQTRSSAPTQLLRPPVADPAEMHERFMEATNAHDVEGLLALYAADGVAVQLDGTLARGADGLRAMAEGLTAAIARIDGSTRKLYVAGDVALSSARWTAEVVLPDGTTLQQSGTTAEVSVRRPDGSWQMVIDDPMF